MNILITGVNGDIGLSIYNILIQREDVEFLVSTDTSDYKLIKKDSLYFKIPHSSNTEEYLKNINQLIIKYSLDVVIPSNELEILTLAKNNHLLERVYLLTNNSAISKNLFSKYDSLEFLRSIGVKVGDFSAISNYDNRFSYPFYLKLNQSSGSKGVHLVDDYRDYVYLTSKYPDSVLQEKLISDKELTVSVFSNGAGFYMISFIRELGYGGLSKWVRVIDDSVAYNSVKIINEFLGIKGSYNVQGMIVENEFIVFEINMRISSTVSIRHMLGFEDLNWWLDSLFYNKKIKYKKVDLGIEVARHLQEKLL